MAKFVDLTIDTLQIAEEAVTGLASRTGSGTLAVSNPGGLGIVMHATATGSWSDTAVGGSCTYSMTLARTAPSAATYGTRQTSLGGNTGGSPIYSTVAGSAIDLTPGTSPTYNFTMNMAWNGGGSLPFFGINGTLSCFIYKK